MTETRTIPAPAAPTYLHARALLRALPPDLEADQHWATLGRALGVVCTHCHRPTAALGMCDGHYRRHQKATSNEAASINRKATR